MEEEKAKEDAQDIEDEEEEEKEKEKDVEQSAPESESEEKISEDGSAAESERPGRFLRFVRDLDAKLEKVFGIPEVDGKSGESMSEKIEHIPTGAF